ncbi:DUF2914 domain-containing protein [Persicimonas caeni]|uniref:DUF2914 domain-containing protein n=1 Tax=Persicimonas caeni TaxID=2292766 RepID=A0A4Y6PXA1_PERCE|nr:DUF2914 domain-containing protein [Persicimonas caeni]QDG52385.1 DUF2914 domain-containing protein [Persicimonas caeni]QED33607.1 DUF2914 domain-containing protein [Persicimonas caeni]
MKEALRQHFDRLDERWELRARAEKWRPWFPVAFFVGGFLFDVLTLGRVVTTTNLIVVGFYALGVAACLVAQPYVAITDDEGRADDEQTAKWVRWLGFGLNFCLGSLFSALVVVYFRSAGEWFTLLTVMGLFAAMVFNEFAHWDEKQRHLLWAIYCVSLVMLLNFVVPHIAKSISPWWFYLSSAAAVGLIWGLCRLARQPYRTVYSATGAAAFVVGLYVFGLVPPVPLVMKHTLIGTDFQKTDGEYTAMVDEQNWLVDLGLRAPTVVWEPGEHVAVLTAIFAPDDVEVDMEHRWYREVDGEWTQTDAIPFHMRGGRQDGWRMWSRKRHVQPGRWRVETAVKDGTILGYETFVVEEGEAADKEREAL